MLLTTIAPINEMSNLKRMFKAVVILVVCGALFTTVSTTRKLYQCDAVELQENMTLNFS